MHAASLTDGVSLLPLQSAAPELRAAPPAAAVAVAEAPAGDVLQRSGSGGTRPVPASTFGGPPGASPAKSAGPSANSKEFDEWKKRTDNEAAAVLAAVRVFRGPYSPPLTHVIVI